MLSINKLRRYSKHARAFHLFCFTPGSNKFCQEVNCKRRVGVTYIPHESRQLEWLLPLLEAPPPGDKVEFW